MRIVISIMWVCFWTSMTYGQQELQYTQFMYNRLSFNPAYAGSEEAACLTAIYRNQWIGLEGAPESQLISYHTPLLNKRVGLGFNISRSSMGIGSRLTLEGTYVYRIRMSKGKLGIGIMASMRYLSMDYTDERLFAAEPILSDGGIPVGNLNRYIPNFGVGAYYNTNRFYIGFSVPRLLRNNIDFNDLRSIQGREVPHLFAMTGYRFQLNKNVDLQPQLLVKFVENAPIDFDLNLSFYLMKKFMLGGSLRTGGSSNTIGESFDVLAGVQLNDKLFFGMAYDITFTKLKSYNNGTIEALARFCFANPEGDQIVNPRFF